MSSDVADEVCASCGIAGVDDVKLMNCDAGCDLVKYCSNECQDNHKDQHEEECMKRKAELRDRDLFTMPDGSHLGECPICCLPLPLDESKSRFTGCCSKIICQGCDYTNQKREIEAGLQKRCIFCREPTPDTEETFNKYMMKRIKKNCPAAMSKLGRKRHNEGDYETALKYFTKAAGLGDTIAHFELSIMYRKGEGVEKNKEKAIYHAEEASIGGHPNARFNLGYDEYNNGRYERARRHFIIAANLGYDDSLKAIKILYTEGHASKEDYADALRAYQTAVEATKSAERDEAEAIMKLIEADQRS